MQLQICTFAENIENIFGIWSLDEYVYIGVFHFSAIYIVLVKILEVVSLVCL